MSVATATYRDLALDIVRMIKEFEVRNTTNHEKGEACVRGGYIDLRHYDGSESYAKLAIVPPMAHHDALHGPIHNVYGGWLVDPDGMAHGIPIDLDLNSPSHVAKYDDDDKDIDDWSADDYKVKARLTLGELTDTDYWDKEEELIQQFLEENQVQKIKYSDYFDLGRAEHPEYFALDTDVLI